MDVAAWLRDLNLGQYERAFRDNDVDARVLTSVTADDLKEIGVTSVGHRRLILQAIAELSAAATPESAEVVTAQYSHAQLQPERRQLTVMFVDLVGSTELSVRLDPEELRAIMRSYQNACADTISGFGGQVAKFMGDGLLAYFGWPAAHEDAAERAVRAGLQIVNAVTHLVTSPSEPLAARVGIATGLAVVGDLLGAGAAREEAVVGEVANLAARLQQHTAPGTVIVAEGTRRLLGSVFELLDLGPAELRGFPEPMTAWRVVAERYHAASRFEARRTAELTPLIGRDEELWLLLDRWRLARDGEGQAVLLTGEPGGGKSRLAEALAVRLVDEPYVRIVYQCSAQHAGSALQPFAAHLQHAAGFLREDPPESRLAKLESLLVEIGGDVAAAVPPLAALLGIPTDGRYPAIDPSRRRKERTFDALLAQIEAIAARQPVLLVFEDLHWIDPTSLELLGLLIGRLPTLPVLAILTARSEFEPPWTTGVRITCLPLDRLRPPEAVALAESVSGKLLPPDLLNQIVARTDGVPLFVEELTRTILEAGVLDDAGDRYVLDMSLRSLAIPATLQDSLMARLDRLGPAKKVAQLAACFGREFTRDMLAAVATEDEEPLDAGLDKLVGSGLVLRHGKHASASYAFGHALVQETAYGSLLKTKRQLLHARIAEAVENKFPDVVDARPEWLAHHYTEAGQAGRAAGYWLMAARRAKAAHANREAQSHLRACLAAIEEQQRANSGTGPNLVAQEVDALLLLGDLASLEGYLEEANRWYDRALAIVQDAQSRSQIERKRHLSRIALRDGARIAFYEHGSGRETLLFVAPLAYGLATFQPIVERLCQEFRVVTVDSRGTGASDPLVRPYPLSEHVKDVRAVIEELGGDPVVGVGISRGGNLLLRLAHEGPHLLRKLVTIGCSPGPPGQFFSEEYLRQSRSLIDAEDLEGIVKLHTSLVFSERATRELQELFVRTRLELRRDTLLSFFDPDPTVEVTPMLGQIAVPVLVSHGGADRLITIDAAEFMIARLPHARLHVFMDTGHLPLFTETEEFCDVLRRFAQTGTSEFATRAANR